MKALFSVAISELVLNSTVITALVTAGFPLLILMLTEFFSRRKTKRKKSKVDYTRYEQLIHHYGDMNQALKKEIEEVKKDRDEIYYKWRIAEDTISKLRHSKEFVSRAREIQGKNREVV